MKKKWNAIMAVFCILLTACTNSDNTDTNQIIAETIKTESVNSEIPSNQTVHDFESESSVHKVYPANGSVKKLLSEFAIESRQISESGRDNAAKFIVNKLQSSGWNVTQEEFPVYRYKDIFPSHTISVKMAILSELAIILSQICPTLTGTSPLLYFQRTMIPQKIMSE